MAHASNVMSGSPAHREPPVSSRAVLRPGSTFVFLALLFPVFASAQETFSESMVVRRTVFTVRLVDAYGKPILGLRPDDFVATIGGIPTEVTSVNWVAENAHGRKLAGGEPEVDQDFLDALAQHACIPVERKGRLFVFYFQTDFARNTVRLRGQMNAILYVDKILDSLLPEDRVAVFSYDSHLRFHLDFTEDRKQVREATRRSLRIETPPAPRAVPEPSLAACLDRTAMRRVTSDEQALRVIAHALREIPGEKQLILVGTRFGTQAGRSTAVGRIEMDGDWKDASRQLIAGGIVVNAVYAMEAGWSGSLGVGLKAATAQTGGFFVRADFQGLKRIEEGELTGRYQLEVRVPADLAVGTHVVAIRGAKRKDIVLNGTLKVSEERVR